MAKFIVEVTKAFKVEAVDEAEAHEVFENMDANELEDAHEASGFWMEVTAVYECDELDVDDDDHALNEED